MFLAKNALKICKIEKNCVPLHRIFRNGVQRFRDLAQLVAHTSGGREVAGSSPVIPTKKLPKGSLPMGNFFYCNAARGYTMFTIRILAARMMMFISKPMRMKSLKR